MSSWKGRRSNVGGPCFHPWDDRSGVGLRALTGFLLVSEFFYTFIIVPQLGAILVVHPFIISNISVC